MHGELAAVVLVLVAALVAGRVAVRFGYPSILGELIGGIILGPPLLGVLRPGETISLLGEVGVLLMMLYIGLHLDLNDLKRASVPGLLAAAGGFVVPAGLGFAAMALAGRDFYEGLFVGLAMGVTSLATKSRILVDLRILDTRIAHVLMAGALISDLTVLVVFAAVVGPGAAAAGTLSTAAVAGVKALAFGLAAWLVGSRLLPLLGGRLASRLADLDRAVLFVVIIILGLGGAWLAELAGLHAILGAFVAGLVLSDELMGAKAARDVQRLLATVSIGFLAPLFFVSAGFDVSFSVFSTDLPLLVAVIALATVGKVVGTALFYLPSGNGWREGVVVGAGMNGRGAVEIIVAELALEQGLISQEVFSILVFMAIFTTATVPVLLTQGVAWLRKRGELTRAGDRRGVVIVGAGPVARVLGRALAAAAPVTLVDTNPANQAAGRREGLQVVGGSGLDELTLKRAGIDQAAWLVAVTPNSEVNLLAAQLAVDHGVPEVAVLVGEGHDDGLTRLIADLGASILNGPPVDLTDWDHAVLTGEAEEVSVVIEEAEMDAIKRRPSVGDAGGDALALAVIGNGERTPFTSRVELHPGDEVVMLARTRPSPRLAERQVHEDG